MAHYRNNMQFGDVMRQFARKEETDESTGFSLAINKFSEVYFDIAKVESFFCEECEIFIEKINEFLTELLEQTKRHKKVYDQARADYDRILVKVATLKEAKKLDVVKLYQVEKERAQLGQKYLAAQQALENHCDDIDDKLNFTFVEYLIRWFNAERNMFGLAYFSISEISQYLVQLQAWCREEARVCDEHRQERETKRKQLHEQQNLASRKHFAEVFTMELIQLILSIQEEQELSNLVTKMNKVVLPPAFVGLLYDQCLPIPPPLLALIPGMDPKDITNGLEVVQSFVKENFDVIGLRLLEKGQTEVLINLGKQWYQRRVLFTFFLFIFFFTKIAKNFENTQPFAKINFFLLTILFFFFFFFFFFFWRVRNVPAENGPTGATSQAPEIRYI
eukprot:TRINITY_DN3463_c0_g3_i8.p1 TRINITY_DN3463_c0_g3~~TRINITY_DN3463_c0_g3_i8.p1  ORF type:complete len:440 (+),score=115.39 TRINITY_DN3463_c0_g3_i8:148-1320(+)